MYDGNLSKNSAWHNQAIHKMYRSWWRPHSAHFVSTSIVSSIHFLAFVIQAAYVLLHFSGTLARKRSVIDHTFISKTWSHGTHLWTIKPCNITFLHSEYKYFTGEETVRAYILQWPLTFHVHRAKSRRLFNSVTSTEVKFSPRLLKYSVFLFPGGDCEFPI